MAAMTGGRGIVLLSFFRCSTAWLPCTRTQLTARAFLCVSLQRQMDPALLAAVAAITLASPEMGLKKLIATVRATGVECGTKEVRAAVAAVKAAGRIPAEGAGGGSAAAAAPAAPAAGSFAVDPHSALTVLERAFSSNTRANNIAVLGKRCWYLAEASTGAVRGLISDKRGSAGTLWIDALAVDGDQAHSSVPLRVAHRSSLTDCLCVGRGHARQGAGSVPRAALCAELSR